MRLVGQVFDFIVTSTTQGGSPQDIQSAVRSKACEAVTKGDGGIELRAKPDNLERGCGRWGSLLFLWRNYENGRVDTIYLHAKGVLGVWVDE